MLIGNLTRDPELRYTPQGTAVCTMGLATNRGWVTDNGEKKEETEFHRIVAWNKLAELCSQLLFKGRRVYVEGRLQTRQWTGQDGMNRQATEIVIEDMLVLDSKRQSEDMMSDYGEIRDDTAPIQTAQADDLTNDQADEQEEQEEENTTKSKAKPKTKANKQKSDSKSEAEEVAEDIPF